MTNKEFFNLKINHEASNFEQAFDFPSDIDKTLTKKLEHSLDMHKESEKIEYLLDNCTPKELIVLIIGGYDACMQYAIDKSSLHNSK